MLSCHACMRRCLQVIIGESTAFTPSLSAPFAPYSRTPYRRSYTSQPANITEPKPQRPRSLPYQSSSKELVAAGSNSYRLRIGSEPRPNKREQWLASRGTRPTSRTKPNFNTDSAMSKHLSYLKDPLQLADFTRKTLRNEDFDTAEKVVRAASKNLQCTVSWNHLVDYQLSKGRMNAAIKTFNEMKKRGQAPDSHTYTIIFRGCSEHKDTAQALSKVLSIYHSMLTEKSAIKPNTIHMNAVLKMCARAQNMEALFTVAEQMPAKGVRAPNNLTFTTIINALRIYAVNDLRSTLTPMQKRRNRQRAILDTRRIWDDVTKRWRSGDIIVDEELVCAMGRTLLIGDRQDLDDVLSLIEQTMNIPRQIPRLGTPARASMEPSSQGKEQIAEHVSCRPSTPQQPTGETIELASGDHFRFIELPKPAPGGTSTYVRPGQNSLSLILQALLDARVSGPAIKYWEIFTKEVGVRPDAENYHAFLRVLRVKRASSETVEVLLAMPQSLMEAKTFRISMAACERDKANMHVFANSGKVLDIMQMALAEPDVLALQTYLEVAITAPAGSCKTSSTGHNQYSKRAHGAQIMRALHRLTPSYLNLRSILSFGDPSRGKRNTEDLKVADSVLRLTQRMIAAYDLLMNKAMVPREQYLELTQQRSKLAAFVTRKRHLKDGTNARKPAYVDFEIPKQYLGRILNPELQRKILEAKKSTETWQAFLGELQTYFATEDSKDDRKAWESHVSP